jgi:hypothetical protein
MDEELSEEDAWLLQLPDIGSLTERELRAVIRLYKLFPAPANFEEMRESCRRVSSCKDIVNDWDDPNDFRWWVPVFRVLAVTEKDKGS